MMRKYKRVFGRDLGVQQSHCPSTVLGALHRLSHNCLHMIPVMHIEEKLKFRYNKNLPGVTRWMLEQVFKSRFS